MTAGIGSYGWRFDSGRVCLDLLATTQPAPSGGEPLDSEEPLAGWLVAAGLLPDGTPLTGVDADWVARFAELRDGIGRLVAAELAGRPGDRAPTAALAKVNEMAVRPPPGFRAVRGDGGGLVRVLCGEPDCAALLAVIARDVVDLFTDPVALSALRQCQSDHCRRVYLDTSRGRRRRWCSSAVCGNRERVARHRRRTSVAPT